MLALGAGGPAQANDRIGLEPNQQSSVEPTIAEEEKLPGFLEGSRLVLKPRSYYLNRDRDSRPDNAAWALGGSLEYRSGWWLQRVQAAAAVYTSQKLYGPEEKDGTLLFKPGPESFSVLGEANLTFRFAEHQGLRVGRQRFELPYLGSHDIRMVPNTFEAVAVGNSSPTGLGYIAAYVDRIKRKNDDEFIPMSQAAGAAASDEGVALVACSLQKGVAAAVNQFVYRRGGTIVDYDQYVNTDTGRFFARMEWIPGSHDASHQDVRREFVSELVEPYGMEWRLHFLADKTRIAVFVTREMAHLYDLLMRTISGQWNASIALIVSNHPHLAPEAERFGIPYHHVQVDKTDRQKHELMQVELLEQNAIDLVVLARYMQIVTPLQIAPFAYRIINIHHSMLPAFIGAKPYHQAHARGVKLIGATSHYVTEELDAGPIIAQDVVHVDHKKPPARLAAIGRDLETKVLARAVDLHLNHRLWVDQGRTIIFE